MNHEAEQIRAAVRSLRRPSANTPYPRELRRRVTEYVRRRRGEGATWDGVSSEVGLGVYTLRDWLEKDPGAGGRQTRPGPKQTETGGEEGLSQRFDEQPVKALIPVRVKAEEAAAPEAGTLELLTPQGYRLSGLSVAQAAELLRQLS